MGDYKPSHLLLLLLALLALLFLGIILPMSHGRILPVIDDEGGGAASRIQTYIIYVKKPKVADSVLNDEQLESWHKSFLPNTTLDSGEPRLVYSYRHVISGFAARLTPAELKAMEAMDGFLDADLDDEEHRVQLRTTYTHRFLGLSQKENGTWHESFYGQGVVIGVLDSGIHWNHASFSDKGMPAKPMWWNATCNFTDFTCNRKIIGAANFLKGNRSAQPPDDETGHGTHVASIAAGNFVDHASVLGSANGTASGMAPKAHLAIYKTTTRRTDILGAIDQAIKDGVHVLSVSRGVRESINDRRVFFDSHGIGMLSAVEKGIFVCTVAGNDGPNRWSLDHGEPWVLTVGASTTDRRIAAVVELGNGVEIMGETAFQPKTFNSSKFFPLVYPGIYGDGDAEECIGDSLRYIDVKEKIVLCATGTITDVDKGRRVLAEGGAGMILMDDGRSSTIVSGHVLPVSYVNFVDGVKIKDYIRSTKDSTPNATIVFKGTQFGYRPSPMLATMSSRGPSIFNGGILKPDVLAPGVNILGAWPSTSSFYVATGTSMATPHVSGIAALIKNKHPSWTPAYIRSAIITSATSLDLDGNPIVDENTGSPADIFGMGAGQVRAWAAMDPGLIYDLDPRDYIGYLCGLGYSNKDASRVARREINCSTIEMIDAWQLNYPSIGVHLNDFWPSSILVTRTVTNVGEARSTYTARITEPTGVRVDLSKYELHFSRLQETASFNLTLSLYDPHQPPKARSAGGKLEWISDDKKYTVTSPIAVDFTF